MTSLSNRVIKIKPVVQTSESIDQPEINEEEDLQAKQQKASERLMEAEQIKTNARQEAEQIKKEVEEELAKARQEWADERESLIESTREEGYQDGFKKGQSDVREEFQSKLDQANDIIDQANEAYHQKVQSSEETIIELALRSAERIIGYELNQKDQAFVEVVKTAIQEVRDQPEITVTVHPDQYHHVFSQQDELQRILYSKAELSIHVRDDVDLHACFIESPFGLINAGVDQQLNELRQKLFEVVNEELGHE